MIDLLLAGAAAYGAYRVGRNAWRRAQAAAQARQRHAHEAAQCQTRWEKQEQERKRAAAKTQQAARLMQLAIIQLGQSPDFRRAATFAKHAKAVPLAFRVRQFRRLRPLMVEHFATRLRHGTSAEELMPGLTELVTALGMADYEADYIRMEAEGQRQRPAQTRPGFASQLQSSQTEHEHRIQAIRDLPDLPAELREQLIEAEQQRFRDQLLAAGDQETGGQANQ